MTTNVTPKEMKRKFEIFANQPLQKYMELYEQVFDIDVYAYRVYFRCGEESIDRLCDLPAAILEKHRQKPIEIRLMIEHAGG
jgi:hypothetical protein